MRPYRNGSSDTSPGSQAVLGSALRFNATKLLPVFDGYTVLQLSDLHIETTAQCAAWKPEVRGNRTGRGWFKKGQSGNPSGLPKTPPVLLEFAPHTDDPDGADRRTVGNLVVEARRFSGLAVDTLVELTKNTHTDSTRYTAPTALLDRGYGRPVVPISSANRSPWTSTFRLTR